MNKNLYSIFTHVLELFYYMNNDVKWSHKKCSLNPFNIQYLTLFRGERSAWIFPVLRHTKCKTLSLDYFDVWFC